jgi:hypothetical protein
MKEYKGWEIVKLISEKKIKEGTKIIKHYDNNFPDDKVFIIGENTVNYEDGRTDVNCSYLSNRGYFTIEETPVSFMEAIASDKRIKVIHNNFVSTNRFMTIPEMLNCMSRYGRPIELIEGGQWYIEESEK